MHRVQLHGGPYRACTRWYAAIVAEVACRTSHRGRTILGDAQFLGDMQTHCGHSFADNRGDEENCSMNMRQMTGEHRSQFTAEDEPSVPNSERLLTLLAEGAALATAEIEAQSYEEFRTNVSQLTLQLRDRLPDDDKLALIRKVLREFEAHRDKVEGIVRERVTGWRALVTMILKDLLESLGIDAASDGAASLLKQIGGLRTGEELDAFRILTAEFFRLGSASGSKVKASPLKETDYSTENLNAAGLRGGGAAVQHVGRLIDKAKSGFVVFFRLGSLNVINQRYGIEAVQDCVMAVSAYLAANLRGDDAVYHWSDSSLIAILETPAAEAALHAAMQRVVDNNRDITIQFGERRTMLRIPLTFELAPIDRLRTAEDLYRIGAIRTV